MILRSLQALALVAGLSLVACSGSKQEVLASGGGEGAAPKGCQDRGVVHEVGTNFPAPDGCNTCTCTETGVAACTERACLEKQCGARAGDTCSETEYCAYVPGEYCGAADAQSVCKPRPQACTFDYRPVCGCDNKTYSNACAANAAGQGVVAEGECPPEPPQE